MLAGLLPFGWSGRGATLSLVDVKTNLDCSRLPRQRINQNRLLQLPPVDWFGGLLTGSHHPRIVHKRVSFGYVSILSPVSGWLFYLGWFQRAASAVSLRITHHTLPVTRFIETLGKSLALVDRFGRASAMGRGA
jgi:hypothetical protein